MKLFIVSKQRKVILNFIALPSNRSLNLTHRLEARVERMQRSAAEPQPSFSFCLSHDLQSIGWN